MNILEQILEEIEHEAMTNKEIGRKQCEGMAKAMNIIRSHMDEAENDGWISVEERLPEEDDGKRYIVTDEHGLVRSEMEYGHPMDGNREVCFHKWDDEYWSCYRPKVIAWQPLQEPYKPKQDYRGQRKGKII